MHTATKFNSRFIKADNRQGESFTGYRALSSQAGDWISVRDIYIAPGKTATTPVKGNCLNMFLPILGTARISGSVQKVEVEPEEIFCFGTGGNIGLDITNPHTDEIINLLQVSINDNDPLFYLPPSKTKLHLTERNKLAPGSGFASGVHAGLFRYGAKGIFSPQNTGSSLLCYVINGTFDVNNRLIENRDALFIWDANEIHFESLSEESIILFIECSPLK